MTTAGGVIPGCRILIPGRTKMGRTSPLSRFQQDGGHASYLPVQSAVDTIFAHSLRLSGMVRKRVRDACPDRATLQVVLAAYSLTGKVRYKFRSVPDRRNQCAFPGPVF